MLVEMPELGTLDPKAASLAGLAPVTANPELARPRGRRSRKVVREGKVGSEPETMATWLSATGLKAVGAKAPPPRSLDVPLHCNGTEKVGD